MKLTQGNFDTLVNNLNHKMTNIERDVAWMKKIGYWMTGVLTLSFAASLGGLI